MRLALLVLPLFAWGCESETSSNCSTEWECINDICTCADDSSCADAEDCDIVCEVCE